MTKLINIVKSKQKGKKYVATFDDGTKTHFGAVGYSDFTKHHDTKRKEAYIKRHKANEKWSDPKTAGSLSRYILWNKPSIKNSIIDFKKRFNL